MTHCNGECWSSSLLTDVPPLEITVLHVGTETVSLGVAPTDFSVRFKLYVDYCSVTRRGRVTVEDSSSVDVKGLTPGTEYNFSITREAENGNQSKSTSVSVFTGKSEIERCFDSNFTG